MPKYYKIVPWEQCNAPPLQPKKQIFIMQNSVSTQRFNVYSFKQICSDSLEFFFPEYYTSLNGKLSQKGREKREKEKKTKFLEFNFSLLRSCLQVAHTATVSPHCIVYFWRDNLMLFFFFNFHMVITLYEANIWKVFSSSFKRWIKYFLPLRIPKQQ